ncbi:MAG: S-layer homology domain-containing protein [Oscillospiraceae bacterium]|nr:S-layer homology domain-containing protein [Oscillospiraceae bacterium]
MKKTAALIAGLLLCLATLTAAGGNAGDPLISRSYLEETFFHTLEDSVNSRLDQADAEVRANAGQDNPQLPDGEARDIREHMLKRGDVLSGGTGMSVTLLGGEVRLNVSGGGVVDVTEGTEVPDGTLLQTGHRYIVAENASADFTVAAPVAVLSSEAAGTAALSREPDHFAIARALRSLGLFQGSGSGFGEGFDLHRAPTRGEGLVMFLRLLGEEEQALAWTGSHPFTDVPRWLDRYVAWAYANGYANGVGADRFGCGQKMSAVEYTEFLLRAMGYSTAGVDDYAASLERALDCGLLTDGEYAMLREDAFLRAHVAYLSYIALDASDSEGETLARRLTETEVITEEQLAGARSEADLFRTQ